MHKTLRNARTALLPKSAMLIVAAWAILAGGSVLAQELKLLTENGLNNPKYSEYAQEAVLKTGGEYSVSPDFSSDTEVRGPFPFSGGRLTNGDSTFNDKREPAPYSYWQNVARGDLVFDLREVYRIRRVRACILNSGPHGTARVELFAKGDPLEFPEALKQSEVTAQNGWNEFSDLDLLAAGVRLRLTGVSGKDYITISEVEVWGEEVASHEQPATSPRINTKAIRAGDVTWYCFDFGPAGSPQFADFTPLSKDALYNREQGYGWLPYTEGRPITPSNFGPESARIPGLGERDRGTKRSMPCDALYRDFVTACEYYHTQVRQTFVLDVPSGTYRVMTLHGDQVYGQAGEQPWWIEAEGERVIEKLELPASLMSDAVFDVSVGDGQLTLTFDAAHPDPAKRGFVLNGLAVLPANTEAERDFADDRIERIREILKREREDMFTALFRENPYVEDAEMPPVSPGDTARGYVAFVPHWMANVYPNSVPRPADLTRPLGCFACPGEYEPMAVALRALKDLDGVTCAVSDLDGPEHMPATAVQVRSVTCWPQRLGSSWSSEWRVMPELLEVRDSVQVPKDVTQEFWLILHVPEDAKPGVYAGVVTLAATNGGTLEIPMTIEVLPFRLVRNEKPVGMYWYEHEVAGTPARDVQVRDMLAHGMTALTMGRLFPKIANVDGKLLLDVGELRVFLQDLKALGIKGPVPYLISGVKAGLSRAFPDASEEECDALYVEAIGQLEAVSSLPDTLKLLYYPVDEIGGDDERGRRANHACGLIAQVPGATSYITVNNYAGGEKWGDTFDIWCGNIEYTAAQEQALLAKGKRYMRYGSAYLNDARKARSSCGFGFYRRPAEAMFYWHYQACNGDPFNDLDGNARDWCAAYPGPGGEPIPTIDWEALREGIDDMKYIATLKQYAARVADRGGDEGLSAQALRTLEEVLGGDERVNQYTFRDDLSDEDYHALRRRLADAILDLHAVLPAL